MKQKNFIAILLVLSIFFSSTIVFATEKYKIIAEHETMLYKIEISNLHENYMGPKYGKKPHININTYLVAGLMHVSNLHLWVEECQKKNSCGIDIVFFDSKIKGLEGRICKETLDDCLKGLGDVIKSWGNATQEVLDDIGLSVVGASIVASIDVILEFILTHIWTVALV